jgi:hypothetical protein
MVTPASVEAALLHERTAAVVQHDLYRDELREAGLDLVHAWFLLAWLAEPRRAGEVSSMDDVDRSRHHGLRFGLALVTLGVALLAGGWVVVGLLVPTLVLPGGGRPPLREVFDLSPSPVYPLGASGAPPAGDHADLHIDVLALDQLEQLVALRVSGYRACAPTCEAEELVLVSLRPDEPERRGLPPRATVPLPAHDGPVQATVELPVQGRLIQYPFDSFDLLLGVALQRVGADGATRPVPSTEAASHLRLTLQEAISQMQASAPVPVDPTLVRSPALPLDYVTVQQVTFGRKDALKLMTVLLVALIALTALCTVMLRSFRDLALSFGGLILGVWSVRAILVPSALNQRTGVDIALLLVIVFLLVALGVRAALIMAPRRAPRAEAPPRPVDWLAGAGTARPADRERRN